MKVSSSPRSTNVKDRKSINLILFLCLYYVFILYKKIFQQQKKNYLNAQLSNLDFFLCACICTSGVLSSTTNCQFDFLFFFLILLPFQQEAKVSAQCLSLEKFLLPSHANTIYKYLFISNTRHTSKCSFPLKTKKLKILFTLKKTKKKNEEI